jgi:type III pantothenate kinase
MLLVVDVGNTNTVIGVFVEEGLRHHWRLQTHHGRTSDEHGIFLRQLFSMAGLEAGVIDASVVSCVVPPMESTIVGAIRSYFSVEPRVVRSESFQGMPILYRDPREVGADRIVNAVAAWTKFQSALVVVDFGTATTFDAISERGEYLGGAICPGVRISSEALFRAASRLPKVDFKKPERVIGRTTVESIQSGLLHGYAGLVTNIVKKMVAELESETVHVIATGGLASMIARETGVIDEVDEFLTLKGLRVIYDQGAPGDGSSE